MNQELFEQMYQGQAPWDTGRPQPAIVRLAEAGLVRGSVLDVGCGTGEHVLYFAARGHDCCGIDFVPVAIERAKAKAAKRGIKAEFLVGNALELDKLGRHFDTVIDSGLLHTFADEERPVFVSGLAKVLRPGGLLHILCFSDEEPGTEGPRRVAKQEIQDSFRDGWKVLSIEPVRFRGDRSPRPAGIELQSRRSEGLAGDDGTGVRPSFASLPDVDASISFSLRHAGQYHGASVFTGRGLRLRHLAQWNRLPFTAVFWPGLLSGLGDVLRHRRLVCVSSPGPSRDQLADHIAVDVGQAEIPPGVAEGELLVIEAQQVQHRGVQVVNVDVFSDRMKAEFVGGAVDVAALDAAAGQPHREAVMVVVAAVDLARVRAGRGQFHRRRAAKFAAPDDQRLVEQAALLQVLQAAPPIARSHCPASRRWFTSRSS